MECRADPHARSVIAETCQGLEPLVATLTYLIERTCTAGVELRDDRAALLRLLPSIDRLRDALSEAVETQESDPSFGLGLRDIVPKGKREETRLEDMYRPHVNAEALEIASSWAVTGGPQAGSAHALFDGPIDAPPPEPRETPRTADDLLAELLAAKGQKHTMYGTTACLGIGTVFQVLARSKRTGRLEVRCPDETLTFALLDGDLAFTATDRMHPGQRLGEILVAQGHVTQERLDALLANRSGSTASGAQFLGALLEQQDAIDRTALTAALTEQARLRFERAQKEQVAAFAFYPGPSAGDDRLRMRVLELLLESVRQQDDKRALESQVTDPSTRK
ncbi:MAG: DUF4388 domain-containing protein [Planctomycetes bacterium]|nr:DUF4388 domain-containing protein [Planctomycetota bacterium]